MDVTQCDIPGDASRRRRGTRRQVTVDLMLDFAFTKARHIAQMAFLMSWHFAWVLFPLGLLAIPSGLLTLMEPKFHATWLQNTFAGQEEKVLQLATALCGRPVATFVGGFFEVLGASLAALMVAQVLAGNLPSLSVAWQAARARWQEIFVAGILMGALTTLPLLLYSAVWAAAMQLTQLQETHLVMLTLGGPVLMLGASLWIITRYSLVPALVAEGFESSESFGCSNSLSQGHRGRVLGSWCWLYFFIIAPLALVMLFQWRTLAAGTLSPVTASLVHTLAIILAPARFVLPALLLYEVRRVPNVRQEVTQQAA
jgi:hypothetical protein